MKRSTKGCWICRLRRKKCDENRPVCEACAFLWIPCNYSQEKPDWMDGGSRQDEMTVQIKRQIKERAHRRRESYVAEAAGAVLFQNTTFGDATAASALRCPDSDKNATGPYRLGSSIGLQNNQNDCTPLRNQYNEDGTIKHADAVLLTFYLESLLPFLFPFYQPSILQGGKAWMLELVVRSAVFRQATLCQSSYFLSLAREKAYGKEVWQGVLKRSREAFEVLRQTVTTIENSDADDHLQSSVHALASILQMQRFEAAVLSFNNCEAHLNAALALFRRILNGVDATSEICPGHSFDAVMGQLDPRPRCPLDDDGQFRVPSAEQNAFRFSVSLLLFDDIIASTVLQEQPRLYSCHQSLLVGVDGGEPLIDMEAVIGCKNWALVCIGEIAALDAWKQKRSKAGDLDVMELVRRASTMKSTLQSNLAQLDSVQSTQSVKRNGLLEVFAKEHFQNSSMSVINRILVTKVWAHAALVYLTVIVSGWQPASVDVRCNVSCILELLTHPFQPALLMTIVWPLCIAGCLAEPSQEIQFDRLAEALHPPGVFGTVCKAFEIMKSMWSSREAQNIKSFATYFRSQGDLVLLI